jgi:hypothetical protein
MKSVIFPSAHRGVLGLAIGALVLLALPLSAQDASSKPSKPTPTKIESQLIVIGEPVVLEQWPHTLKLVNAPTNVSLLNPGQCIRVGVYATGDTRDSSIDKTKISFRVEFAGRSQEHPLTALAQIKQIKPEGGDFVTAALGAAGIENPLATMASLGVSADGWCVPADAQDGKVVIRAEVESPGGRQVQTPSTIQIESFETGSKRLFNDPEQFFGNFLQTYYRQPNPARLLPALQFLITQQTEHPHPGLAEEVAAFLSAALKSNPVAAKNFLARIAAQPPLTRAFGLLILRAAGYDISSVLNTLSTEEQQKFGGLHPLDDPFDLTPTQQLFGHLDLMWSTFGATGEFVPVQTIAGTLAWRPDYDDFQKAGKAPDHHLTLTPSIVRGVAYTAAGWSLDSVQRNDPLAADYIECMIASPDTPEIVKSELKSLSTNPAFKRDDKK